MSYEWMGLSKALENGLAIEDLFADGWELEGGALRRPVKGPLIINIFGAPCAGKSVMAADVFSRLKKRGYNVELAGEYAKDMTYSGRWDTLRDQIYIFAKQRARIERLVPHCDVIVTDCPVLLGANYYPELFPDSFRDLLMWAFDAHQNLNIYLTRQHEYSTHGRRQTEEESDQIANEMLAFLTEKKVIFSTLPGNDEGLEAILALVEERVR